MHRSSSPHPPLLDGDDEHEDPWGDIIASFPAPVDTDLSFDDLSAIMRGHPAADKHTLEVQVCGLGSSCSTIASAKTVPPPKDDTCRVDKAPSCVVPGTSKRFNEPATPVRPLKRLKAAIVSRQRSIRRSPHRIHPPSSATQGRSTPPSSLHDVLAALRNTQTHLTQSVDALETARFDLDSQKQAAQRGRNAVIELLEEARRTEVQLVKVERQNAELRRDLRQLRADSARASADHRTTVSRLEESLAEERGVSEGLRCEVVDLQRQNQSLVSRAERRFSELEQELAAAHGETAMAKEEGRAVRTKLNEAELAHRALKEGGARLQRELAERDRRIGQFEKGKGKRWNMI